MVIKLKECQLLLRNVTIHCSKKTLLPHSYTRIINVISLGASPVAKACTQDYKCVVSLSELSAACMLARVLYDNTVIVAEVNHHGLLRHAIQECERIIQYV